ncbi:MAG: hypothetical protein IKE65_09355 [Clostridia bacterium]|nr:hypothetical protein [Clostridia bacterium]
MIYSFAGLLVDIRFRYEYGVKFCERYLYTGDASADFTIEVDDNMMALEREYDPYNSPDGLLECLAAYREICNKAFDYGCMFMHCSALSYRGNGVLFTAPSGTGKSTHSALWKKYFGESVTMVNDDKPLLKFEEDAVYVCGTPWDGKHRQSNNIMVPIKAIVILSQGKTNEIHPADKREAVYHLLNQTIRPEDASLMGQVLDYCERLLKSVPIYCLQCDISFDAVLTAYNTIKENFDEDEV